MGLACSADGTRIAFDTVGTGPQLLLVHGATVDSSCWKAVLPLLRAHFTVHAMDRRGRAGSGDAADYAPEREAEDIIAVLDQIGAPAFLFGHSSGAICAMAAAERASERLMRTVLYEPPLFTGPDRFPADLAQRLRALLARGDQTETMRTFLREGPRLKATEIDWMQHSTRWPATVALAHTTPYDAQIVSDYVLDPRRLAVVRAPSLLLLGENSPPRMRAAVEAVARALPHGSIALLPGQEHVAMYSAPALLAGIVTRFLLTDHLEP